MNAITNPHSPDKYRINGVVCEYAGVRPRRSPAKPASRWSRERLPGVVREHRSLTVAAR